MSEALEFHFEEPAVRYGRLQTYAIVKRGQDAPIEPVKIYLDDGAAIDAYVPRVREVCAH